MGALPDGFTHDELTSIAMRKVNLGFDISATDINRSIPYSISQQVSARLDGYSDEQLRIIAEGKMSGPPIQPSEINSPRLGAPTPLVEDMLSRLQQFLGIRTR